MSEENKEKIAAVVVTYNRKQLLGECLNALLVQSYPLDAIYIIDNASTDGTPEYLMEKGFIDKQLFSEKEPSEFSKSMGLTLWGIVDEPTSPETAFCLKYPRET